MHADGTAARAGEPAHPASRPAAILTALFRDHVRFVWRVLASYGVATADVEDAVQEVFLTVHRRMNEWDAWDPSEPRSMLFSIARRVAANYRRRTTRRREMQADLLLPPLPPDPASWIDREATLERVRAALDGLTEANRETFVLFEVHELPMREVAEVVGCPLQTAYARLYAARRALAGALEREEQ